MNLELPEAGPSQEVGLHEEPLAPTAAALDVGRPCHLRSPFFMGGGAKVGTCFGVPLEELDAAAVAGLPEPQRLQLNPGCETGRGMGVRVTSARVRLKGSWQAASVRLSHW